MTIINTKKTLVLNYFTKESVEEILDRKISNKQYRRMIENWDECGYINSIFDVFQDWLNEYY